MKIIYTGGEETVLNESEYALCLGMFDGVHKGHRALLEKTAAAAGRLKIKSGAVTFTDPAIKNRIYLLEHQARLFEECGTDALFVVRFDEKFKSTSPEDFVKKYLSQYMRAKHIVCGTDFTFGKDKSGDAALLEKLGEKYGYSFEAVEKISSDGKIISSTYIRELLGSGSIKEANSLLGKAFHIGGCVSEGNRVGRTIGYPTVNIDINSSICDIKSGVYESEVSVDGVSYPGITNIGEAPTVNRCKKVCETYIIGAKGNIYNKYVYVSLTDFIRPEKKFPGIDELKREIKENVAQVCAKRGILSENI